MGAITGRGGYNYTPGEDGEEEEEVARRDLIWVSSDEGGGGGVGGLGGVISACPEKTIYLRGG